MANRYPFAARGGTRRWRQRRRRGIRPRDLALMLLGGVSAGLVFAALPEGARPGAAVARDDAAAAAAITVRFPLCGGGRRVTCVVDGDTIWLEGSKIRIADIDTPEVFSPKCPSEAALGRRATLRMQALLNAGPITLSAVERETDRYGRTLRVVSRGGVSLGDTLVAEGLAHRWGGPPLGWC